MMCAGGCLSICVETKPSFPKIVSSVALQFGFWGYFLFKSIFHRIQWVFVLNPEERKDDHNCFFDSPLEDSLLSDETEDCSGTISDSEDNLFICFFL